jgi:hypothetical protein
MANPPSPLYVFPHVPKCAGSSISQFFRSNLPSEAVLRIDKPDRAAFIRGDDAAKAAVGRAVCAVGHHLPRAVVDLAAPGREVRQMVLIRDPVGYFRSLYIFNKTHSRRSSVRSLDFERWYSLQVPNPIVHTLLADYFMVRRRRELLMSENGWVRHVSKRLAAFWFVGSHRHCQTLIDRLAVELGVETARYHRNAAAEPFELPAGFAERIRADNAADSALFEAWGDRLWDTSRDIDRIPTVPGRLPFSRIARTVGPRLRRALLA